MHGFCKDINVHVYLIEYLKKLNRFRITITKRLTSWVFTVHVQLRCWTRDYLEQVQLMVTTRLEPRDYQISDALTTQPCCLHESSTIFAHAWPFIFICFFWLLLTVGWGFFLLSSGVHGVQCRRAVTYWVWNQWNSWHSKNRVYEPSFD